MNSTNASSSNPSKKIKLTIIPPRQLFVNISSDEDVTTTPSPTTTSSSPTPPIAPSKTTSTSQTSSSQENTSFSFHSKSQILPPSSNEPTSPHHLNPLLDNILDVPPSPLNPQPLQSQPSLDITLSLSLITPLDHIHDIPLPSSPPQPQPPIMGHPLFYNYHDYYGELVDIVKSRVEYSGSGVGTKSVFKIKDAFGNKQYYPEDIQELFCELFNDVQNIHEELAEYINTPSWNRPIVYYDDDDDDEDYTIAITPDFLITHSLSMGDEHLSTIPKMKSDELIKSGVENLVPNLSESEDLSNIGSECNVPVGDDFTTFSNSLFDAIDNDFTSSDDESFFEEDIPMKNFKIFSNPLFDLDEEIISTEIDSLLEEFSGELAHIDLIPPRINEADFDPEEEIRLVQKLLYDNSSPRPPKEFNSENSDAIIECFSLSSILVNDSDSLMEEIDLFLTSDDSMPPGIENDDYDSEGDILFLKELLSNASLPENESFHFDFPSSPRPPAKPSDVGIYFEPDRGLLTTKVVSDISEHYILMPRLLPTQPTLCPVIDTLLPFSSKNEDKVHLLSYRGFKAFQLFSESPMMIYGGNIPILEVPFLHFYPP
nr:hypothetical protein [Tanacetum cinerariifolium]